MSMTQFLKNMQKTPLVILQHHFCKNTSSRTQSLGFCNPFNLKKMIFNPSCSCTSLNKLPGADKTNLQTKLVFLLGWVMLG
jgi:hypothetical protein